MNTDINYYSSKLQDQTSDSIIIGTGGKIAHNIGISQDAIKNRKFANR